MASKTLDDLSLEEKRTLVETITLKKNGQLDKDWSEICDDYDLDIAPDTLRKAGVGIKLAADAQMLANQDETFDAYGGALGELSGGWVERQKMRDFRAQVNKIYRAESRSELLRESVFAAVRSLPELEAPVYKGAERGRGGRSLVVVLGDIHYGADILVKGLQGEIINRYNHDVFIHRMEKLFGEIVDILAREDLTEVYILMVGDLIDGMLRKSQLMKLEYGVVDSTINLAEYLARWLNALSEYASVRVYDATGNHSEVRPLDSKKREFEDENMERIVMWYLSARFDGSERVFVDRMCSRYAYLTIQGFWFLLLHGDCDKSMRQLAIDAVRLYGKPIDYFVCGHLHREEEIPAGSSLNGDAVIIRVPSLCGVDRYAQNKGYGGKAGATAMVIEKGYGRRCIYPINLQ